MTKLNILWIDDNEEKVNSYTNAIEHGLEKFPDGSKLEKLIVKSDFLGKLEDLTKSNARDLIIIDQVFTRTRLVIKRGSTVAHVLRDYWPQTPMVCVTAEKSKFNQEEISEYTALFEYANLGSHIEEIYAIARDFPSIKTTGKKLREHLAKLVGVPASDMSLFLRVLPAEFDAGCHLTTQHRIAYWIFNVFMVKPGFLYNKLRSATYLGLNEAGFDRTKDTFEPARYKGLFFTDSNPLWWVSELEKIILEKTPSSGPASSQLMGRSLAGITQIDHSRCFVEEDNQDHIPDVVARIQDGTEEKAVCAIHTQNDPEDKTVNPGFESLMIIGTN